VAFPPSVTVIVVDLKVPNLKQALSHRGPSIWIPPGQTIKWKLSNPGIGEQWINAHTSMVQREDGIVEISAHGFPFNSRKHVAIARKLANSVISTCDRKHYLEGQLNFFRRSIDEIDDTNSQQEVERLKFLTTRLNQIKKELSNYERPVIVSERTFRSATIAR
jgi:hypothetical protein